MRSPVSRFHLEALIVPAWFSAPVQNAEPQFPQSKEYNVAPGSTLDLNFNANMDWELSVPENSIQWFWIQDGSFSFSELSGKASDEPVAPAGASPLNFFN